MSCTHGTTETARENEKTSVVGTQEQRKYELVYINMLLLLYFHLAGLYGFYLCITEAKLATLGFEFLVGILAEIGVTAGAHRLWTHRAYKAKLPLQILLMLMQTIAYQDTVTYWVREHRLHHKYTDTDADPHNASRGFFFSHIGWLMTRKHPDVKKYGKNIDISDILNNPVLKFQRKYAKILYNLLGFGLPTIIPVYCWGETWHSAWHICMFRYVFTLQATFLINSAAHLWGSKPYDKNIMPTQNLLVSLVMVGEGFHNYHHVFPWDYRAAELGNNYLNLSTKFIDFFAAIGWAYDLKTVPEDMIKQRASKTGDGTNLWGWGDKDMKEEIKRNTQILYETSCSPRLRPRENSLLRPAGELTHL